MNQPSSGDPNQQVMKRAGTVMAVLSVISFALAWAKWTETATRPWSLLGAAAFAAVGAVAAFVLYRRRR
jgi:membrane protein YdbS with pleckstrin-like domain